MNPPVLSVRGGAVPVLGHDIDTDRIIPARFLKCVRFDELGEQLFFDERFDAAGQTRSHPLDLPAYAGATVLISGRNFGCGSSREHAPQALKRAGFRAIIAESFAEIFAGNALALGLICVTLDRRNLGQLVEAVRAHPDRPLTVDIHGGIATTAARWSGEVSDVARQALGTGRYDPIAALLEAMPAVRKRHGTLPYVQWSPRQ